MSALETEPPVSPKTARGQIEEFDYIISTIDPRGHSGSPEMEKAKRELIVLAEQGYWPACLELYEKAQQLFHFDRPEQPDWNARDEQQLAYNQAIAVIEAQVKASGRVYLERAAKGGYAPAQFRLAMELEREAELAAVAQQSPQFSSQGEAGEEEPKKEEFTIQSLLEQAADQGYAPAQFALAQYLLDEMAKMPSQPRAGSKDRILSLLEAAGQEGHLDALLMLGKIYSNHESFLFPLGLQGLGVEVDHKKAAQYYLAAAQQGSSRAITSIVELLGSDDLTYYQALKQLAEEGYVEAQYQLGVFYQGCTDRSREDDVDVGAEAPRVPAAIQAYMDKGETAEKWYEKAANNGNDDAQNALNALKRERRQYPDHQRTPYHAPEQPASGALEAVAPLPVEEWDERSWTSHYNYLWRKQRFEDELLASSEGLPVGERKQGQKNQLTLGRFSWKHYVLGSLLGTGSSILAFQFSGSLSMLTALGFGPVSPFFLVGIMGALLATSLVIGLHLSLGGDLNQDTRKALLGFLVVLAPLSLSGLALLLAVTVFASTGLVALALASLLGILVGVELVLSLVLINTPKDKVSVLGQKNALVSRNPVEAFDWITLASSRDMDRNLQKTKNELLVLAEQGYWPACLELYEKAQQLFHFDQPESPGWGADKEQQLAYDQAIAVIEAQVKASGRVYLERAAKGAYAPAQFHLAIALQAEEKAAAEAAGGSGFGFGNSLLSNPSLPQDQGESRVDIEEQKEEVFSPRSLLEQAAAQGYAPAKFALALVLIEKFARKRRPGLDLERDQEFQALEEQAKIVGLLEASVKAGNPVALVVLGDMYSNYLSYPHYSDYHDILENQELRALGIEADHDKALGYYRAAVKQGSLDAIRHLAALGRNSRREPSIDVSVYYPALKQLAEEGYVEAQYQLGAIYGNYEQPPAHSMSRFQPLKPPVAVQADMDKGETAEKWWQKAANNYHYGAGQELNRLRVEQVRYPDWGEALYYVSEQPESVEIITEEPGSAVAEQLPEQKQAVPAEQLSVQAWHKKSWMNRCDYNWRKRCYDRTWFVANPGKVQAASQVLVDLPAETLQRKLFTLLRFFWPRYSLGFLLGAGGSILAFQFSGSLSVLTALGLGPVAPFFLIGAVGALLGISLVLAVHLSVGGLDEEARKMFLKSLLVLAPLSLSGLALLLAVTVFAGTGPAALAIASVLGVLLGILPVLSLTLIKPSHPVARMLLGSLGKGSGEVDPASKKISKETEPLLGSGSAPDPASSSAVFPNRGSRSRAFSSQDPDEDDSQRDLRFGRSLTPGSYHSDSDK